MNETTYLSGNTTKRPTLRFRAKRPTFKYKNDAPWSRKKRPTLKNETKRPTFWFREKRPTFGYGKTHLGCWKKQPTLENTTRNAPWRPKKTYLGREGRKRRETRWWRERRKGRAGRRGFLIPVLRGWQVVSKRTGIPHSVYGIPSREFVLVLSPLCEPFAAWNVVSENIMQNSLTWDIWTVVESKKEKTFQNFAYSGISYTVDVTASSRRPVKIDQKFLTKLYC